LCYCAYSSSGGVSGFGVVVEVEWIIPVIGNTVNYVTSSVLHSCRYTRGFFQTLKIKGARVIKKQLKKINFQQHDLGLCGVWAQ